MTSAAYDCPHVVWVAAGGGWANDSVSCPRSGEVIVARQDAGTGHSTGHRLQAAQPAVVVRRRPRLRPRRAGAADDAGAAGHRQPRQRHPGRRGRRRAGRRSGSRGGGGVGASTRSPAGTARCGSAPHTARVLLAKNPGGLAGGAVDGRQARRGSSSSRSTGRCPTARTCRGCGTSTSSIRRTGTGGGRRRRTRHRSGRAAGLCGCRPHAGARHREGDRVVPARARRGGRQLHRVPAVEPGVAWRGQER